jgi:cytochrome P450
MSTPKIPATLPRASDLARFMAEPLEFLEHARRVHGNLFVISDDRPFFSRATDCAGAVVAFGVELQRAILGDIDTFGMPISAARHLKLPENLINLNRSLHSMAGLQHVVQKQMVMRVLDHRRVGPLHDRAWAAIEEQAGHWSDGATLGLLGLLRDLTVAVAARVLFGGDRADDRELSGLLRRYFELRRDASSPAISAENKELEELVAVGHSLDAALRKFVRECRRGKSAAGGILAELALLETDAGIPLTEDDVVGHSNVLFVSSTEPVAVALAWIILILSQLPSLSDRLRGEARSVLGNGRHPTPGALGRLRLLDCVIKESLRLLPPNAFMVRITNRPAVLLDTPLPARCEVILCPLLAHRDGELFPRPTEFLPDRWIAPAPPAFAYFPFGAGGHACAGASLAISMIKLALAYLLPRYELVLAGDQQVDWRLHIQFMPRNDPAVRVRSLVGVLPTSKAGTLGGPVARLLGFDTLES